MEAVTAARLTHYQQTNDQHLYIWGFVVGVAVPLVAALATAAGTAYQVKSASDARSQANDAVSSQLAQQKQFTDRAKQVVSPRIAQTGAVGANKGIDSASAQQLQRYQNLQSAPLSTAVSATPQNAVLNTESKATIGDINQAAARLAGYGTWENAQDLARQNADQALGVINLESQNAGGVLPYQLDQISNNAQGSEAAGSLLSSAGSLAGTAYNSNQLLNKIKGAQAYGNAQYALGQSASPTGTGYQMTF